MKKIYEGIKKDSLYRNSSYLIASNVVMATFGFIFWVAATKVFTTSEIGLASTLISGAELVMTFALLGLNSSLVRYLPTSQQKDDKINTVFTVTTFTSIFFSIIFIIVSKNIFKELQVLYGSFSVLIVFIIFVLFLTLAESIKGIFRSFRRSEFVLIKNIIFCIFKVILIFVFINFGTFGIFSSWLLALIISSLVGFIILIRKFGYKLYPTIKAAVMKKMISFSFANYVSGFLERSPKSVIPLIITIFLGPEKTAYFYIDMSIASFLFMLTEAIGSSFYAESSNNEEEITLNTKKSLKAFVAVLLPSILIIIFFGNFILLFFGKEYSDEGSLLLKLLALSTVFIAFNSLYSNTIRVKFRMKRLILVNFIGASTILGLSYLFIHNSIVGIGWAWLLGNAVMSATYLTATLIYKS